jgi:methylenetetrahydrofolate dehydrogenase (NADP+)/methenyltetrahydrofolate cyclohydrolase
VLVGDAPACAARAATVEAGIRSEEHWDDARTPEAELMAPIGRLNRDPGVYGIVVQPPLPAHIETTWVPDAVASEKDVDGFHIANTGRLATERNAMVPRTPLGCLTLLRARIGPFAVLEAIVVGRSNIVGRPLAQLLIGESCTVTVAHPRTRDLAGVCRRATSSSPRSGGRGS